ncbi:outer membrane beta-barrel protein [Undibacterium sp. Ji22W]|uniref:outer membrane beta-barrel protein n=1 Tax=Undibacterium sp. Ji22W TaxID=3413038 RepID=UPI003BF162EB
MIWNRKTLAGLFVVATSLMSGAASAQGYVGVAVGSTKWSSVCWGENRCSSGTTTKLTAGYTLDKNFAIEGSIYSLGNYSNQLTASNFSQSVKGKGNGVSFAGVFNYEFSQDFSGFAKLGIASMHRDVAWNTASASSTPVIASEVRNSTQAVLGLGVKYKLNDRVSLTLELEQYRSRYNLNKPEVRTVTTGVQFAF